jgi:anthranilate synthase component 1
MKIMTVEEFKNLAKPGYIVPVFRKINADFITPVMAYLKIRDLGNYSFLLESVEKGEQIGRYSFIGQNPYRVLIAEMEKTIVKDYSHNHIIEKDIFEVLKEDLGKYQNVPIEGIPQFSCGTVGFIGYEMIRCIEDLPEPKKDVVKAEDAIMAFYDSLITFDHLRNEVILIANTFIDKDSDLTRLYQDAQNRLLILFEKLNRPLQTDLSFSADIDSEKSNFEKEDFKKAVEKSKEYIFAGDIFQVVLSQKFQVDYSGDIFQVYRALRNINPSPYMFYLDFIDYQIIGSSPESVISSKDQELEIIPIAGTRPRGDNSEEDEAHVKSLLADPKENAEHIMLVDLARNDMGRISEYGSVEVSNFKTIEKYSHVMHIISRVHGKLKKDKTSVDAFRSAFPAGTVSGAPKIRAMEIIHELEPDKRGFYAGAIGYFNHGGNMDMAIAIRTMLAKDAKIFYQAGAGIVADSVPDTEYQETLNKGRALRKAIEQATGGFYDFIHR